jgi:hypothetical protein
MGIQRSSKMCFHLFYKGNLYTINKPPLLLIGSIFWQHKYEFSKIDRSRVSVSGKLKSRCSQIVATVNISRVHLVSVALVFTAHGYKLPALADNS